eukprot:COSAG01_NODE_1888_length_8979_cov_78.343806_9_plen_143_part_00
MAVIVHIYHHTAGSDSPHGREGHIDGLVVERLQQRLHLPHARPACLAKHALLEQYWCVRVDSSPARPKCLQIILCLHDDPRSLDKTRSDVVESQSRQAGSSQRTSDSEFENCSPAWVPSACGVLGDDLLQRFYPQISRQEQG